MIKSSRNLNRTMYETNKILLSKFFIWNQYLISWTTVKEKKLNKKYEENQIYNLFKWKRKKNENS